jgi:hypothetical protein
VQNSNLVGGSLSWQADASAEPDLFVQPQPAARIGAGAASPVTSLRKNPADPGKTCCGCGKKGAGGVVPAREGGD